MAVVIGIPANCYAGPQEIRSGSIVVFRYSKEEVAIAGDSRRVDKAGTHDDQCKVFALSDKLVFGFAGVESVEGPGPLPQFDAVGDARTAAAALERAGVRAGFTQELAHAWTRKMSANFQAWPQETLRWAVGAMGGEPGLGCGVFAGLEASGEVSVFLGRIVVRGTSPPNFGLTIKGEIDPAPISEKVETGVCGRSDTAKEFVLGRSEQAAKEQRLWAKWRKIYGAAAESKIAIRLVELTVTLDHSGLVGGPVDAVELRKGSKVHWIQRKPSCPPD